MRPEGALEGADSLLMSNAGAHLRQRKVRFRGLLRLVLQPLRVGELGSAGEVVLKRAAGMLGCSKHPLLRACYRLQEILGGGPMVSPRYVLPFRQEWEDGFKDEDMPTQEQKRTVRGEEISEAKRLLRGTN